MKSINWDDIRNEIHQHGYVLIRKLIEPTTCLELVTKYSEDYPYRKEVNMARYRFGEGTYKYYQHPLPPTIQELRTSLYSSLVPLANRWMELLRIKVHFPDSHSDFLNQCHVYQQTLATPLILRYDSGGFNTLHQDLYGEIWFPFQVVIFLSESGKDYTGGEFILTEQVPRAQTKAMAILPKKGDALILATQFRPIKGKQGFFRANMKHGVSKVHTGQRFTLGIIFHDATS